MKPQLTAIAGTVALILTAQPVFAESGLHEEAWGEVNLYGNTSIADDSPLNWGPWKEFIQPAAGGPVAAAATTALPGGTGGDTYLPLPLPVSPPQAAEVSGCGDGAWCGYLTPYSWDSRGQTYAFAQNTPMAAVLIPLEGPGGWGKGGSAQLIGTPLHPSVPALLSNLLGGSTLDFGPIPVDYSGQPGQFLGYLPDGSGSYVAIRGGDGAASKPGYDPSIMTVGLIVSYTSGTSGRGAQVAGAFVAGTPTTLTDMAALQAGNVQATYTGATVNPEYGGSSVGTSPVRIDVNFGNATWSGSWNNGKDGAVHLAANSDGSTRLFGAVGYNASGTISGATLQSTSLSTSDVGATVSGYVQGQFAGANAAGIVGISEVTKTTAGYSNALNVDMFVATRTGSPD